MPQPSLALPPLELIKTRLHYDPDTGFLFWKVKPAGNVKVGDRAGSAHWSGYRTVVVDSQDYLQHRIAWLLAYEEDPGRQVVEHINCVRSDNRLENLRLASWAQNQWNATLRGNNTSGVKGVNFNKQTGKWMARVQANDKSHYLGLYDTIEQADQAVRQKRLELHGEFARSE